jgi:hypothetical protein
MVIYRLIEKLIYIRYKEDLWSPVLGDELINTYTYALRILVNSSSGTVKQQLRRIFNNRIFITDEGRYQYEVITAMVVRLRGILEYVFDVEGAVQYINTHIINSTTLRGLNNCFRFELGGSFDYRPVKISKCFPENWIDVIPSNFPVSLRTKLNVLFPQWNPAVTNVIAVLEGDYLRNEEYYLVNENGTLVNYEPINAPEPVPVVNNDQVGFPVDDVGPEWEPFQPHEPAPAPAPAPVENFFEVGRLNAAMRNDEMKLDFNNGFIRDLQRGLVNHEALTTIYDNNLRNFFDTRYGALCLYGSLAFLGEIIQQEPLSAEQSRRHSLAKVLSRFRMVPEGEVNLENRSLDLVSGEYIVISLGYGPRTMFYGIRKDTIELVFNNVMRGETVYNSCIKLQGFVADNDRVTVETTECYAKIPIGVPVFVDLVTLYKLYLLSKVFRPVENEQLIVYLEMVSSDVLMKSFNRASPGDERNVFAIGRVVSNRAEVSFNLSDLLSDYLEIVNAPAAVGPASPAAPAPAAGPTAVGPASPAAPAGSPINLSLGSRYSVTPMRSPMRSPLELSPDRRSAKPPGSSHDRI